jgi:hypothetical protein
VQIELDGKTVLFDDEDYEKISCYSWHLSNHGIYLYAQGCKFGNWRIQPLMHRLIMEAKPGTFIDHKNHNGLDNRRCNLRECSNSQNIANQMIRKYPKTSVYKGVYKFQDKWKAQISVDNIRFRLGCFDSEKDAAMAYNNAAIQKFGDFALLNKI